MHFWSLDSVISWTPWSNLEHLLHYYYDWSKKTFKKNIFLEVYAETKSGRPLFRHLLRRGTASLRENGLNRKNKPKFIFNANRFLELRMTLISSSSWNTFALAHCSRPFTCISHETSFNRCLCWLIVFFLPTRLSMLLNFLNPIGQQVSIYYTNIDAPILIRCCFYSNRRFTETGFIQPFQTLLMDFCSGFFKFVPSLQNYGFEPEYPMVDISLSQISRCH